MYSPALYPLSLDLLVLTCDLDLSLITVKLPQHKNAPQPGRLTCSLWCRGHSTVSYLRHLQQSSSPIYISLLVELELTVDLWYHSYHSFIIFLSYHL